MAHQLRFTAPPAPIVSGAHVIAGVQVEPARMPEMPFLLKMLYEEGLIDEEVILQWGSVPEVLAVSKKAGVAPADAAAVRDASRKVLDWLAEDDSSDEDHA